MSSVLQKYQLKRLSISETKIRERAVRQHVHGPLSISGNGISNNAPQQIGQELACPRGGAVIFDGSMMRIFIPSIRNTTRRDRRDLSRDPCAGHDTGAYLDEADFLG